MSKFSHLDDKSRAKMVDVTDKKEQIRTAVAVGKIKLAPETIKKIEDDEIAKGNVLTVAQIAGIQAAKKTSDLIPLCHNLPLNKVAVDFEIVADNIKAVGTAKCTGVTGVEMEAMTAVTVALLTIYDMCKAVDKKMEMTDIKLISKEKV